MRNDNSDFFAKIKLETSILSTIKSYQYSRDFLVKTYSSFGNKREVVEKIIDNLISKELIEENSEGLFELKN